MDPYRLGGIGGRLGARLSRPIWASDRRRRCTPKIGGLGALARLQPLDPRQIRHRRVGRGAPRQGRAVVWARRPRRRCNRAAAASMVGVGGGLLKKVFSRGLFYTPLRRNKYLGTFLWPKITAMQRDFHCPTVTVGALPAANDT